MSFFLNKSIHFFENILLGPSVKCHHHGLFQHSAYVSMSN